MNLTRSQIIIISIAGLVVLFFILVFLGVIPGLKDTSSGTPEVQLSFWGVENQGVMSDLIDAYSKLRPNVSIVYSQIPEETYEESLISALAAGRGPDLLMFRSSWLPKHSDKIYPAAETQISLTQVQQLFPKVAEQDFTASSKIYALPLYIDTLALIYNKDVFDAKAIAIVPQTWQDFQILIPKLRELNEQNQIAKAAAAIGGSKKSLSQASDLLDLIMTQFGSPRLGEIGGIQFGNEGLNAFNFYLQFANPASVYYTWNDNLTYSLDALSQGKTALIFDYASVIPKIKSKNPFINIGVAPMLQFKGANQPIDYADYWGVAVSKQSRNPGWAWDFVIQTTTNSAPSESYLKNSGRPPALRTLIAKYSNDPNLGVFAKQALTARSWPKPDSESIKKIFSNAIESVLTGRLSSSQALEQAENEINSIK